MQKKELKSKGKRKSINLKKKPTMGNTKTYPIRSNTKAYPIKSTNKTYNKKNIKGRMSRNNKRSNLLKLSFLIAIGIILLLLYLMLGAKLTMIMAVGIGIVAISALLLKRISSKKKKKKILKILLIIILTFGIIGLVCFSGFLIYIKSQADKLYNVSNLNTNEVTIFYDKDGYEFYKLGTQRREKVSYDELPEVLIDAIIATEDSRFFKHNGFDAPRFIKAALGQVLHSQGAGGASTLSMQVVKNSFTDAKGKLVSGVPGIIRKFEDIYLAVFKLEKDYTKQQIIEYYVNNHYLGGNIYGVEEAAQTYFGKSASDLNLSEAAILAGMFKSPNEYRPTINPEKAAKRRNTVLYLMRKHGYITKEEENMAKSIPVESLTAIEQENSFEYQGYVDTVAKEIIDKYGVDPYTTSLLIYTNLDRAKQNAVNSVLNGESYNWINEKVQTGVSVLDSQTGKILAVGTGRNRSGAKQYNYATGIKRQPGSTAKPLFDYGPGIEYNNWSTYTLFNDAPYTYSNGRSIKNWDGGYFGTITLRRALSASRNVPALKAFQQVDNQKIIEFVTGLGLTPEIENGKIHEAHSIGAFTGTNPVEMSAAYAAFSNGGIYHEPYTVTKIVFRNTGEIKEHIEVSRRVMSEETAFMITSVLQDVALTGGTPKNVACKTGTTNYDANTMNNLNMPGDAIRDSWVIGYSTKTVIGMWYGYDNATKESVAQGYVLHNVPATIQKDRLFNALVSSGAMEGNRAEFVQPAGVVKLAIVAGSNPPVIASPGNYNVVYEYFKKDYQPEIQEQEQKLATPTNFKVSYDEKTQRVSMSWDRVSGLDNAGYGTFGYNIYLGSTLIAFSEANSYSYTTSTPYGTYRVVATYKNYSTAQSDAASYTLKEKVEEKIVLSLIYNGPTTTKTDTLELNISNISVLKNGTAVSIAIENCSPTTLQVGANTVNCNVTYEGKNYNLSTTINVTQEQETPPQEE